MRRCQLPSPATTAAQKLSGFGWTPYLHLDRELVRGDIEIVGGLSGVTTECAPVGFNLFVFVGGRYAGTLAPVAMTHQTDGAAGAVRLLPEGIITAEFARYTPADTPCCPSSRVTVRYHIDMGPRGPLVSPLEVRITR
jgi:hypothetical protein